MPTHLFFSRGSAPAALGTEIPASLAMLRDDILGGATTKPRTAAMPMRMTARSSLDPVARIIFMLRTDLFSLLRLFQKSGVPAWVKTTAADKR